MRTRVQKWGNSLAIRIPRPVASEAGLDQDTSVDVTVVEGKIVVTPARRHLTLDDLLEGMTEENLHAEVDWGRPVGNEVW